jgi:hypothetical protein
MLALQVFDLSITWFSLPVMMLNGRRKLGTFIPCCCR